MKFTYALMAGLLLASTPSAFAATVPVAPATSSTPAQATPATTPTPAQPADNGDNNSGPASGYKGPPGMDCGDDPFCGMVPF